MVEKQGSPLRSDVGSPCFATGLSILYTIMPEGIIMLQKGESQPLVGQSQMVTRNQQALQIAAKTRGSLFTIHGTIKREGIPICERMSSSTLKAQRDFSEKVNTFFQVVSTTYKYLR
jgi:hypothetical protein